MKHAKVFAHILTGIGATVLLAFATVTVVPQQAQANPGYAAQTKKACTFCHSAPPTLNATGKKFQANGHKL